MAWRDSRGSRMHLLLSIAAVALGIAALVAIRSYSDRLDETIALQSRNLLGADLSVRSLQPFTDEVDALLDSIPGEQVREVRFYSMIVHLRSESTRMANLRALSAPYPFYGDFETDPPSAARLLFEQPGALVMEETLMTQFEAEVGDAVRIGAHEFNIVGTLLKVSGEPPAAATFIGPRVYFSMNHLTDTELIREGSLARHFAHYRLPDDLDAETLLHEQRTRLADLRLEMETAEQRSSVMGNALIHLNRYLNLGGFAALLLGGIGLAGAIQLYVRKKRTTVSVLRCLGASARTAFSVYVIQATCAAAIGAGAGALLGGVFQYGLAALLADILPLRVEPGWSWTAVLLGLLFGLGLSVAFALYPLVPLRRVPPLAALRPETGEENQRGPDPLKFGVLAFLGVVLFGFALTHTDQWTHGLALTGALIAVFALLTGAARLLMWTARHTFRDAWPFAWRQGIANIHRPYNQTSVLLLALGLGAFLLGTLALTQENLVHQLRGAERDGRPNIVLFDIQQDQVKNVEALIAEHGMDHMETVPIVTMRLTSVNGRSVGSLRDDPSLNIPHWVLFREYRSTHREELSGEERIIAGEWQGRFTAPGGAVPVSIDKGLANHLRIGLGARMAFDIQGVPVQTIVRSIRDVDWRQMRTNFFVIFPAGVLESAPQHFAMVALAPSATESAHAQNAVVTRYPNVSVVDFRMVVQAIDEMLDKSTFVLRFMAGFCLITGLLVLCGTIVTSRYDRNEEIALYRTLGATRAQLHRIMAAEYAILGGIASIAGLLLALVASWAAARWLFNLDFTPALWPVLLVPLTVTTATLVVGLLATRALILVRAK